MAVTVTNLIQGPGTLYYAEFPAEEPDEGDVNTTPPTSTWTDVGGTQDGVTLTVEREFAELEVDQIVDVPERRITKRDLQVATNLAEGTLENFKLVQNGGAITSGAGYRAYDPADDVSSTQPTYSALMFDGFGPNALRRRFIVRKALSIESPEMAYKKDEQTLIPVTFGAHYVSASTKPFRVIDQVE